MKYIEANDDLQIDYSRCPGLSGSVSAAPPTRAAVKMRPYSFAVSPRDAENYVDSVRPSAIPRDTTATSGWWDSAAAAATHRTFHSPRFDASAWAANRFATLCRIPNGDDTHACHHHGAISRSNAANVQKILIKSTFTYHIIWLIFVHSTNLQTL